MLQSCRYGLCAAILCLLTAYGTPPHDASAGTAAAPHGDPHASASSPPARHALPAADVLIDAGHGGIDGGTHSGDIMEKDINLAISRKLYLILKSRGMHAVLNRTGDYALSDDNRWLRSSRHQRDLSQRKSLASDIGAGIFVSVHVNWSKRKQVHGPVVLHRLEARSALLASLIQDSLNRQQHTNIPPVAGDQFYVLKQAGPPSVIVETGFISNAGDLRMLTDSAGQTAVATAIANGIAAYRLVDLSPRSTGGTGTE
ncbi:N-acetylmuramoyl-L-alanine amidase family protein [Cohnella sp. 56]|uniref:N-acetylmuramoyl-L-alanine amidase family protein n=1 Tax=Cohnella sp. 56 TaxID=3113722 RepID=UPI0030E89130